MPKDLMEGKQFNAETECFVTGPQEIAVEAKEWYRVGKCSTSGANGLNIEKDVGKVKSTENTNRIK